MFWGENLQVCPAVLAKIHQMEMMHSVWTLTSVTGGYYITSRFPSQLLCTVTVLTFPWSVTSRWSSEGNIRLSGWDSSNSAACHDKQTNKQKKYIGWVIPLWDAHHSIDFKNSSCLNFLDDQLCWTHLVNVATYYSLLKKTKQLSELLHMHFYHKKEL